MEYKGFKLIEHGEGVASIVNEQGDCHFMVKHSLSLADLHEAFRELADSLIVSDKCEGEA